MGKYMPIRWKSSFLLLGALVFGIVHAEKLSGTVRSTDGTPVPYAFVGAMDETFGLAGSGATGPDGGFSIDTQREATYIVVQPSTREDSDGLGVYALQPRIIEAPLKANEDTPLPPLDIRLPTAGCLILKAYSADGKLMRWEDFVQRGTFAQQFMYATDLDDRMVSAVSWPVYDAEARNQGSPREKGLPALVVEPGKGYVAHVLFWEVPNYGKLLLCADNAGEGYSIGAAGEGRIIELNVELARTAVNDLARRKQAYSSEGVTKLAQVQSELERALAVTEPVARAKAADAVLALALSLRDLLELESARAAIPALRTGAVAVRVKDSSGAPIPGCTVRAKQESRDFSFGVFEGSPYKPEPWKQAREAGFEMGTVLLGWNWTDGVNGPVDKAGIDKVFGISALRELGYAVKAHGVVWLQDYGILPERALKLEPAQLVIEAVAHERALLDAFSEQIGVWEAMNEPAATNAVGVPRETVMNLLDESQHAIQERDLLTSLVNSPHEVDYGRKYLVFGADGKPKDDYNLTYLQFLEEAQAAGALESVDAIGIQFYPGFHFNETFGGLEGPAVTPSWLVDTVKRYQEFKLPIHITEFSVPSSFEESWKAGYWREPWTEATQADFAETVFTLAYGTAGVQSITWWDISDAKPSVVSGGLIRKDGTPKPAFERIRGLLDAWTTKELEVETDASGNAILRGYAGQYAMQVQFPDGEKLEISTRVYAGKETTLPIEKGMLSAAGASSGKSAEGAE